MSSMPSFSDISTRFRWISPVLCLLLGAITPLSFSPFDHWWVGLFSVALFAGLLNQANSGKHFFLLAFIFALGYFGTGGSWVYVSIYYFGSTPLLLAIVLTALFVSFVAIFFALPFYALRWCKPNLRLLVGIPLLWVLSEWIRTWIFTGFPWLFIGYSHTNTLLAGWAPVGGVLLLSLWSLLSSCLLIAWCQRRLPIQTLLRTSVLVTLIWATAYGLKYIPWTSPLDDEISVGLVQPNIHQNLRWTPEYQKIIPERLQQLSEPLWDNDWIIWPEGAIHNVYHRSLDFIRATEKIAKETNTTVISGVLYDSPKTDDERQLYFNSIISIGEDQGIYHKQRLVPFGEYVPLEDWIRGLIEFFDLPFSVISIGPSGQAPLHIGKYSLANAICYEIAYPALVAEQAKNSHVLLTVSNDAWFGHSIGPIQHFQMARMRAMEIGRYIIRGTNNGLSAIIRPNGTIQAQGEQFVMTQLEGKVIPMTGNTPYMIWKNYPLLLMLLIMGYVSYRNKRSHSKSH
jgi:apolipoprotein N-acyltransferase